MQEEKRPEVPELPFHTLGEKEEWYRYICPKCGMEDSVPGFVVDEFAVNQEVKKGEMPGVACPKCNTEMEYKNKFKK